MSALEIEGHMDELYVCASCGNCTLVCPIYRQMKWESYGPRGKLRILRAIGENTAEFNDNFSWKVFLCSLCEHCTSVCTTGIGLSRFWEAARAESLQRGFQPSPAEYISESVRTHGDIFAMGSELRLNWLEGVEGDVQNCVNIPAEVAYFLGCNVSLKPQLHDVAHSLVKIMDHAGIDYTVLGDKEVCCGAPLIWAGDLDGATSLGENTYDSMKELGVKKIVFSCPSCINSFKTRLPEKLTEAFSNRFELLTTTQLIEQLTKEKLLEFEEQPMITVTYHDSCISARVLNIIQEPRDVIARIPGVYKIEMLPTREETRCCGAHGLLNVVEPGLASKIAEMRLRDVSVTPATKLLVECPRCLMAFTLASSTMGYRIDIVDIVQFVANSLKPKDSGGASS
ncbi:MAG: (Fe-S)-binding protein [Candidatus Thorarchaeota archaeon]